jgi:hypothetical protein
MTNETLKELLSGPAALFLMMMLASMVNGLQQLNVVRQTGTPMTAREYFFKYWPTTLGMALTNVIAFITLVMTDQLNFASALGIGYGVNSAIDLLPNSTRSHALKRTPDDEVKLREKMRDSSIKPEDES